jgi:hypothetical protein
MNKKKSNKPVGLRAGSGCSSGDFQGVENGSFFFQSLEADRLIPAGAAL